MQSGKPRLLYKVNKLRRANTDKVKESLKAFEKLMQRLKKEGETKWMLNALKMAAAKLNKFGFTNDQITKKFSLDFKIFNKKTVVAPKAKKAPAAVKTTEKIEKKAATPKAAKPKKEAEEVAAE